MQGEQDEAQVNERRNEPSHNRTAVEASDEAFMNLQEGAAPSGLPWLPQTDHTTLQANGIQPGHPTPKGSQD